MKSKALIDCLTKEEKKSIRLALKSKASKETVALLDYISKYDGRKKMEKSVLFSLVSKEKYTAKLDFKLRHYLRVLNEEIEQQIILQYLESEIKNHFLESFSPAIIYLDFLLERQSYSLFEKEWNKYQRKSEQKKFFRLELELIDLYFKYITHHQEEKIQYYDTLHNLLKRGIFLQQCLYIEELRGLEQQQGFLYYTTMFTGQKNTTTPKYVDNAPIQEEINNASFFKYHQLLAQSFHEKNHEKRIPIFKALLESHESVSKIRPDLAINERDYNNWLGHCYYFKNDYETSATYFERCMFLMNQQPKWLRLEIVFNYISILTKLERFSEPILIFETYKKQIDRNERVRYRFGYLIAFCLIFEKRATEAWPLLPKDINNRPQNDFYYTRFIMAIIYHEEGSEELFEREVTNIYQTAHYKKPEEILWLDVSKVFRKMSRIIYLPKDEKKVEIDKLMVEMDELDQSYPKFKDVLPVKWLIKQLNQNG